MSGITSSGPAGGVCGAITGGVEDEVSFGQREARDRHIESEVNQPLELDCQDFLIPAGVERQLVVGEYVGPPLIGRHGLDTHARHRRHIQNLGSFDTAMPRQNHVLGVDKDGICEAEGPDAVCDLPDLFARMPSGIARVGL
jgi:hypothetical protein